MSGPTRGVAGSAAGRRNDRWRAASPPSAQGGPASRTRRRLGWTLASGAALAALIVLVVLSLFGRRSAVVLLSIDDYEHGLIAPVPFGPQDVRSIMDSLAGRLSPWVAADRGPLLLDGYATADAMRSELGQAMRGLRLGGRDAFVAVVRGQTLVAPGPNGRSRACLIAEDMNLDRTVPAEIVPCRDLFSALASSPARTTLIVLDMGDLRWDPRLGVPAGLVPAVLDEECREPLPGTRGDCWVLGSHDTHEFSGVSLEDRRGLFLRAVELALAGRADDRGWGGDGDGEVEVHEMARFVSAWTSFWAKRESGGDFDQRPVLWKLGTGRVPLETSTARDIPLIQAGRQRPLPAAVLAADPTPNNRAEPTTAASALAEKVSAKSPENRAKDDDSKEESAAAVQAAEKQPDVWELIGQLADRDSAGASPAESCPVDYAPHVWRETVAAAAAAAATPRDGSPLAERAERIETLLETGLESFLLGDRGQERFDGRETPLARLADSRRRMVAGGAIAWRNADEAVRSALAIRNRAVEQAAAAVGYVGAAPGSAVSGPIARSLPPLLDTIAGLHAELSRLAAAPSAEPSDALVRLASAVDMADRRLIQDVAAAADELVRRIDRGSGPLPAAELRWFAASRLPTPAQRRRLTEAVAKRSDAEPPSSQKSPTNPATASEDKAAENRPRQPRLSLEGAHPSLPSDRGSASRASRDEVHWKHVGDRLDLLARLLHVFGKNPLFDESDQAVKAFHAAGTAQATTKAEASLVAAAVDAGRALASALARLPSDIDRLLRTTSGSLPRSGDPTAAIDALLRLSDPRDAARVPSDANGWVPRVRVALPLRLAVTSTDEPLEVGRTRRVSIGLQSGDVFPAEGQLALDFDPDRLKVRTLGGAEVRPRVPMPVKDLSDRARLVVLVEPRRQLAAGERNRTVPIRAELVVGARRDHGERRLQLPVMERLLVMLRGRTGTVEGGDEQPGGWSKLTVDPLSNAAADAADQPPEATTSPGGSIRLRPFPGQVTAWEVALVNQSGEGRSVDVELCTIGPVSPASPVVPEPEPEGLWRSFVTGLRRGLPLSGRVLAETGPLLLPASEDRVAILLPPPRPADGKSAPETPIAIGSSLALVIRDRGEKTANAKDGERPAEPPTAVRPADKRRTWVVRLPLVPRRPKSYLSASAVWSMQNRSIDITVEPLHGDAACLPESPVVLRAAPLPPTGSETAAPVLRIMQATVSGAQKKAVLRADSNGGEGRPAELGIDVDGYPRAFVFRIDSRPVMDSVDQRPQRDWRYLAFTSPSKDFQAYRPGAHAAVPLGLAVDLPEDMLGGATPPLDVVLREVRQRSGGLAADVVRPAWATNMDRQVECASVAASPPSTFAVRTSVTDWNFPLPAPGFTDVDVVVEARLRLPDSQVLDTVKRIVVFDGTPPRVDLPPRARVEKGKVATIEIDCEDGDRSTVRVDGRLPGSSGVVKADWAIDAKRNGQPDAWQTVPVEDAGHFKLRVPTDSLAIGSHAVLVRVTDAVGLSSVDRQCEVEVTEASAAPADPGPDGGTR